MISTLIQNSHTKIQLYKVKAHAGITGNECADAIAKHQAKQASNCMADTEIPSAGPGGNPFTHIFWLAKEEKSAYCRYTYRSPTCSQAHLSP